MTNKKKILSLVMVLALVLGTIGGTLAWLTDKTEPVVNTFTVGQVDVSLAESENPYKMIPGTTLAKDPKVTLERGSEDAWLFVKVTKTEGFDNYIEYALGENWKQLTVDGAAVAGVYYYDADVTAGTPISVLAGDQVKVKETVTNEMMVTAKETAPKLTFEAYAVQKAKNNTEKFTAEEAWTAAAFK